MTRSKLRPARTKVPRVKRTAPVRRLHRVMFLAALSGSSLLPRIAAQSIEVTGTVSPGTPDSQSSWVVAGNLAVGHNTNGSLAVSGGAVVSSASGTIGYNGLFGVTGVGSVTIDGAGSAWNITNQLTIGQWVAGNLLVSDGGAVTGRTAVIGSGDGGSGTVTITGSGSSLTLSGGSPSQLIVGSSAVGTLNVLDGGVASSAYASVGQSISGGGGGTLLVSGEGSQLTATTLLSVGDGSDGSLIIENGGSVVSANAYLGGFDGDSPTAGAGTALVSGADSTWTIGSTFYIGFHRAASLRIENQAAVTSFQSIIGIYGGAPATVAVSDGGTWNSTGYIGVGYATTGELLVESGGLVITPTVQLGSIAAGSGELILSGNAVDGIGTLETTLVEKGAGSGLVRFDGGRLRAIDGGGANLISGVTVQLDEGGARIDTNGFDKTVSSELTGDGGLVKEGDGMLTLLGDQTYLGVTIVEAGILRSTGQLSSGEVIVQADAVFGASGLVGDLTIQNGGNLYFDGETTLEVLGTVNIDASFGVDNLFGLDASVASGTYSLIISATTDFASLGLENWGIENAFTLEDGRFAYFAGTDLQLIVTSVIPEPASAASLAGLGILGFTLLRRRSRRPE